jgi:hypothetical protein
MSKAEQNKAVVGRWFTEFWGKSVDLGVVDQIAAPAPTEYCVSEQFNTRRRMARPIMMARKRCSRCGALPVPRATTSLQVTPMWTPMSRTSAAPSSGCTDTLWEIHVQPS